MGWFRDVLSGQQTITEQQQRMDVLTADLNEARREMQAVVGESNRLRERLTESETLNRRLNAEVLKVSNLSATYYAEKAMLLKLLEDARLRELRHVELTERIIVVERHNATANASNEWAIAHINMLTSERAALLAQRGSQVPVPQLRYDPGDPNTPQSYTRGAPAQPFDTIDPPPPGPIASAPSIAGVPIPDGQTAGDVLARLRQSRDEHQEAPNLSPEELLRAGADLFDDLAFTPPNGATPSSPFTE